MSEATTCREEILDAFRTLAAGSGRDAFAPVEIVAYLASHGTRFQPGTIRTHIISRLCSGAPPNHASRFPDLVRVRRGLYRLARTE